jgi:hypothetical protein
MNIRSLFSSIFQKKKPIIPNWPSSIKYQEPISQFNSLECKVDDPKCQAGIQSACDDKLKAKPGIAKTKNGDVVKFRNPACPPKK